ncbi:MAG: recombinase family protein [Oscillospiraceae bacterium]|jgi:DNA invertase Pin-like site-specific DNA recombinase|nr:recombinase family protein [Oscillospiraceae bacterium]
MRGYPCGTEEMLHSLAAQVSAYSELIQGNPDWNYCGVYADEALTGTKDTRPEFQRLVADCRVGLIDTVITKSISRFARNTVTLLETVRELKTIGIDVFFEEQNIHSLSCEGELMLTILAGYAQEESMSCSENVKWRIRKDFAEGKPSTGKMLGYRLKDGVLTIVPEEAEVVRQIFDDYLSGMGTLAIKKKLAAEGISFSQTGISHILRNEKHKGCLLLQKTIVTDHISKKQIRNDGRLPQFYVTDSHEPIISEEIFDAVQTEIARRAAKHNSGNFPARQYPCTGMIRCEKCGASYRRKHAAAGSKYEKIVWICATFNTLGKSECDSQQIPEDILLAKIAEVGGLDKVAEIIVPAHNRLTFIMKDGSTIESEWQHRSRSESWTDEMKAGAAEHAKRGGAKNG